MKNFLKKIAKLPLFYWLGPAVRSGRWLFWQVFDLLGWWLWGKWLKTEKKPVKKILLIRLDRVGDLVLTTPAIRAVRKGNPQASIDLLVQAYTKDIVINNPNLNRVLIYGVDQVACDYDAAVAFHPGFTQNYLTYISGAWIRVGYRRSGGAFFLTKAVNDDRDRRIRHEVESALEIASCIGAISDDKHQEVCLTETGESFADNFFKNNDLNSRKKIIIHPGSRQDYLRWDFKKFAQLADLIQKDFNAAVIISGSESERELVNDVCESIKNQPISLIGVKLTELISVINRADLFVGNSTGPLHLAAGLGIKTVAIFGPRHALDSYQQWGPWGDQGLVINKDLGCQHCHPSQCPDYQCLKSISVEQVYTAVKTQLEK